MNFSPNAFTIRDVNRLLFASIIILASACSRKNSESSNSSGDVDSPGNDRGADNSKGIMKEASSFPDSGPDTFSFAEPEKVSSTHVSLNLSVSFKEKRITGTATLTLLREDPSAPLILDTRDLQIASVEQSADNKEYSKATFSVGEPDKTRGAALSVKLNDTAKFVRVTYATSEGASALQWLAPEQTAGKKQPFLFTQSQSIHARSWIPLQDTPGVRITYDATVKVPKGLLALMSAENPQKTDSTSVYKFAMPEAIPPYLIALAVGDLRFKSLGKRAGVYGEPSLVKRAAREFEDTEKMISAAEALYGPYVWGRYDILVLPPSFPFGGMENPRLTFATPTILAGDKSLVSLIAHELAHSWSGNLVTNATWRDFWLNEGFTTYVERRIQEALYGKEQATMEAVLGYEELLEELKELPKNKRILFIAPGKESPDTLITGVPYEKGALFLRQLELAFGRDNFDSFLKKYFSKHSFQSITTKVFVEFFRNGAFVEEP